MTPQPTNPDEPKHQEGQELRTSEEWVLVNAPYKIIDPDGWDRSNFQYSFYEEKITEQEFMRRLMESTVQATPPPQPANPLPSDAILVDPKDVTLPVCSQHGVYNEGETCKKCPTPTTPIESDELRLSSWLTYLYERGRSDEKSNTDKSEASVQHAMDMIFEYYVPRPAGKGDDVASWMRSLGFEYYEGDYDAAYWTNHAGIRVFAKTASFFYAAIQAHVDEAVEKASKKAEAYGRANEHHVISRMLTNEELAKLDPGTIKALKERKKDVSQDL